MKLQNDIKPNFDFYSETCKFQDGQFVDENSVFGNRLSLTNSTAFNHQFSNEQDCARYLRYDRTSENLHAKGVEFSLILGGEFLPDQKLCAAYYGQSKINKTSSFGYRSCTFSGKLGSIVLTMLIIISISNLKLIICLFLYS